MLTHVKNFKEACDMECNSELPQGITVRDCVDMLGYGTQFKIVGAYSGKTYYRSWVNKDKILEKYLHRTCIKQPLYATTYVEQSLCADGIRVRAVIGIWMHDIDLVKGGTWNDKNQRQQD